MAEQERVIDLPRAGFVAPWIVRQLHMADFRKVLFDGRGQVALHDLHVIDVVLQLQVVAAHFLKQSQGLLRPVEEEAGYVPGIDGLGEQQDACRFQFFGGEAQVVDQGSTGLFFAYRVWSDTCQTIQLLAPEHSGVVNGHIHAFTKLVDPIRAAGNTALTSRPVPCGKVVQHLGKPMGIQLLFDVCRGVIVGEEVLYALEACRRGGLEAVEKILLGEQHA